MISHLHSGVEVALEKDEGLHKKKKARLANELRSAAVMAAKLNTAFEDYREDMLRRTEEHNITTRMVAEEHNATMKKAAKEHETAVSKMTKEHKYWVAKMEAAATKIKENHKAGMEKWAEREQGHHDR